MWIDRRTVTVDSALIDRIVHGVLNQLRPAESARATPAATSPAIAAPTAAPKSTSEIELLLPVITADVLQDRVRSGQAVRFGVKSLVTPAAKDWLQTRKVVWTRGEHPSATAATWSTPLGKRLLLFSTITPTVRSLHTNIGRDLPGWTFALSGTAIEAIDAAVRAINTAEVELAVVIAELAEAAACRANRSAKVRSAVVSSPDHFPMMAKAMGMNLAVVNPVGRSFVELRNLLRICAALPKPQPPLGWE